LLLRDARVVTETLPGSALYRRIAEGRAPEGWLPRRPATPNEWRERCQELLGSSATTWADVLAPAMLRRDAAAARLERVAGGRGVVVTTGQQPGLFGGPIYTVAKGLSALALADAIEDVTGIPTAPVFWAATDDADFAEAAGTVVVADGVARELRLSPEAALDGQPMYAVPLGDVQELIERLAQASGSGADQRPISLVRRAYHDGATVGSAYVELLADLLGPCGVTILDAGHAAVRSAGHALLSDALRRSSDVERALTRRDGAIRAAGFDPQVETLSGRSLVFDMRQGKSRIASADAAARARDARPGELAPNVVLRPIVERAILPTVAYAAGPAELAYFAQSSAVAEALGQPAPLGVPRWSVTIVEPHVDRTLAEHALTLDDLAHVHAIEARLARQTLPDAVVEELGILRREIDERMQRLTAAADTPQLRMPPQPIEGARRTLQLRIDRLERRILAAAKRADADRLQRVQAAAASVFPTNKRQERAANLMPFLGRYGMQLFARMQEQAAAYARALVAGRSSP
jgi:bacillithiol synthase